MNESMREEQRRLRAYYLWEADGRPDGRAHEYWVRASHSLDEEDTITAPVDEASAAGSLLSKPAVKSARKVAKKAAAAPDAAGELAEKPKRRPGAKKAQAADSDAPVATTDKAAPTSKKAKAVKKMNGETAGAASPAAKPKKKSKAAAGD